MKLEQIRPLAERFIEQFKHCTERMEIAGSIRRGKPECRDIEIVCIPEYQIRCDLFGKEASRKNRLIVSLQYRATDGGFRFIKGNNDCPKYTQLEADHEGQLIKIDLFFATEQNWGLIYFIRTGSAEWNKRAMLRLRERGYKSKGGVIKDRNDQIINTPEEKDIFTLLGWPWVEPRDRK